MRKEESTAQPAFAIGRGEFVALMAMLVASIAFSIDAMLPAMPEIAAELTPDAPNFAQLIITSFVLGMGIGTVAAGPLSDSFGRKTIIFWGSGLYIFAALLAWIAPSLELLVAARVLQGIGASAARIVPMAIVRDLYAGRQMARIVSFIMMVFTLVPAVAPLLGSGIILLAGWRGIFLAFVGFALLCAIWLATRIEETLPQPMRRPFQTKALWQGAVEVFSHPVVRVSTYAQAFCMTALFASLSSIHQIFDITYGQAQSFPYWFCAIALVSGGFSLLNASVVVRLGMRRLINLAMLCMIALSSALLIYAAIGGFNSPSFAVYLIWQTAVFVHTAMTLGNLNAIALEPMGHLAGMATSIFSAAATIGAVVMTVPIGLMFNGTPLPLMLGALIAILAARAMMYRLLASETSPDL